MARWIRVIFSRQRLSILLCSFMFYLFFFFPGRANERRNNEIIIRYNYRKYIIDLFESLLQSDISKEKCFEGKEENRLAFEEE